MLNIKKVFYFKTISLFLAVIFLIDTTAYGIDLSYKSSLRVPSLFKTGKDETDKKDRILKTLTRSIEHRMGQGDDSPLRLLARFIKGDDLAKGFLAKRKTREDLVSFLENEPSAIAIKSQSEGIKVFCLRFNGEKLIVSINIGEFAFPVSPEGKTAKARTKIYGKEGIDLLFRQEDIGSLFEVHQVKDIVTGEDYDSYAVWQLQDKGLSIGVPEPPGVQVLYFSKTDDELQRPQKEIVAQGLADVIQAAINEEIIEETNSPAEVLSKIISEYKNKPDELRAILQDVTQLDKDSALKKFGEEGIPPVMAMVATLYPVLLEDMKTWNEKVYYLLEGIVNNPINQDVFERGLIEIGDYVPSRNTAVIFSRSYEGRRIFIPIHFSKTPHNIKDGKVWFRLRGLGLFGYASKTPHNVFDHGMSLFYPLSKRSTDLNERWDIGIPVLPGVIDRAGFIQKGLRFQILELDRGVILVKEPSLDSIQRALAAFPAISTILQSFSREDIFSEFEELIVDINALENKIEISDKRLILHVTDSSPPMDQLVSAFEKDLGPVYKDKERFKRSLETAKNFIWWKDPRRINLIRSALPITALRRKKDYPGIGKFKDLIAYAKGDLLPRGYDAVLLLPFFATIGEDQSPYEPVSMSALNELLIDWSDVPEVKFDQDLLRMLVVSDSKKGRINFNKVKETEEKIALKAYERFKQEHIDQGTGRAKQYSLFSLKNPELKAYAEFMALYKITDKPLYSFHEKAKDSYISQLEWTDNVLQKAWRDPQFDELVNLYQYKQWNAWSQFEKATKKLQQLGIKTLFDMPMFRAKNSVDVWKHPEYFRDLRTKNPGLVRPGLKEDWYRLAQWNYTELAKDNYNYITRVHDYWLEYLDGARLDAFHLSYPLSSESGQLASGDEPGDKLIKALADVYKSKGKFRIAEAFEGKDQVIEQHGFITNPGRYWKMIGNHDSPRTWKETSDPKRPFINPTKEDLRNKIKELVHARRYPDNALFIAIPPGEETGDIEPIKYMDENGHARWDYSMPLKGDPDYKDRRRFNIGTFASKTIGALLSKDSIAGHIRKTKKPLLDTEPNPLLAPLLQDLPSLGPEIERAEGWAYDSVITEIDVRGYAMHISEDGTVIEGRFTDIERNLPRIYAYLKKNNPDSKVIPAVYIKGAVEIGKEGINYDGSHFCIRDHKSINSRAGTEEDFRRLCKRAHSLGIRIIVDFVGNHASRDNVLLKEHPEFFLRDEKGNLLPGTDGSPLAWTDTAQFNLTEKSLWEYFDEVIRYWVDLGVDGFRVDVAHALTKDKIWDNWGQYLDMDRKAFIKREEPLRLLVEKINESNPGTWFFMESYFDSTAIEEKIGPGFVVSFLGGWLSGHGPVDGALHDAIYYTGVSRLGELRRCLTEGFSKGPLRYASIEDHDSLYRSVEKLGRGGAILSKAVLLANRCIPLRWNGEDIGTNFQISRDMIVTPGDKLGGVHWEELDEDFAMAAKTVIDILLHDIVFRRGNMEILDVYDNKGSPVEDILAVARTWLDEKQILHRRLFIANFRDRENSGFIQLPGSFGVNSYDDYGVRDLVSGQLLSRRYKNEYTGRKLTEKGLYVRLQPFDRVKTPSPEVPFLQVFNLFPENRKLAALFQELSQLTSIKEIEQFELRHLEAHPRINTAVLERKHDILLEEVKAKLSLKDIARFVTETIKEVIPQAETRLLKEADFRAQDIFVSNINEHLKETLFIDTKAKQEFKSTDAFFRRLFREDELSYFIAYLESEIPYIKEITTTIISGYIKRLPPRPLADFIQLVKGSTDKRIKKRRKMLMKIAKDNSSFAKAQRFLENPSMKRVVFLTSESAPFTQKGGMGQVMSSLSKALAGHDVDVTVVMPLYHDTERGIDDEEFEKRIVAPIHQLKVSVAGDKMSAVQWMERDNVTYLFIDNREFFGGDVYEGDNQQNGRRFSFFSTAALEALNAMDIGVYSLVANDYHSGLAPVLLKYGIQNKYGVFKHTRITQLVHVFKPDMGIFEQTLMNEFWIPWSAYNTDCLEDHGKINLTKGGLLSADTCGTVSQAESERLMQMYPWLFSRLENWGGIPNRIDVEYWRPDSDKISHPYTPQDDIEFILSQKAKNKAMLQRRFSSQGNRGKVFGYLKEDPDALLIEMIGSRGVDQKGVDIAIGAIRMILGDPWQAKDKILHMLRTHTRLDDSTKEVLRKAVEHDPQELYKNVQFLWVANADDYYGKMLIQLADDFPGKVVVNFSYDDDNSMDYYAGGAANLMPSRYEPGGYPQQICQRFGTIPVVHRTGGLADTVPTYDIFTGKGVGMAYPSDGYGSSEDLLIGLTWLVELATDPVFSNNWKELVTNAINEDVSWKRSVNEYIEIFDGDVKRIISGLREDETWHGLILAPETDVSSDGLIGVADKIENSTLSNL